MLCLVVRVDECECNIYVVMLAYTTILLDELTSTHWLFAIMYLIDCLAECKDQDKRRDVCYIVNLPGIEILIQDRW